jgi:predicted acetyltransferase
MPNLTIRPFEDRDLEGWRSVASLTYNDGKPIDGGVASWLRYSEPYVAERNGAVAGIFDVLPMTASRGPALLQCGGVAGVAVSPDLRRGGVGESMMRWLSGHLRERKVQLASLYPFREPFYGKAGYATAGKRLRITVPAHRLPKVKSNLPVRRLAPSDWRELAPCYAAFAHCRSGVNVRSELMWDRVLNEVRPLVIYASGDPVEGYLAVSHHVAFWTEQWISEFAWSTPAGYQANLAMMGQLGINKSSLAWYEPSDSPYYAMYLDQGVEVRVERAAMFRVCDVKGALEALKPVSAGEFTLVLDDRDVPENRGPWRVSWGKSGVEVEPFDGEADIETSVDRFAQCFMGDPSIESLANMGSVRVRSSEALFAASSLLNPLPVYCGDFF